MKNILHHDLAHQKYFEELTRIPHGSFHEKAYSDYLVSFAKEHQLRYKQDEMYNVILYKEAAVGYEMHEPVILQSHIDMVCEKNKDTEFDFTSEALRLYIEDGFLKAQGTTLGADDGVGVAYMLAVLADQEAKHPALECVFTVQEEVGLFGAMALKKEDFHAKRLINLDDGGETSTCITSAGGMNVIMKKECTYIDTDKQGYVVEVSGLSGGHSGGEIHREKGNANKLLTRALFALHERCGIQLHSMQGGIKDNAIPREASAMFVSDTDRNHLQDVISHMKKLFVQELEFSDAGVDIRIHEASVLRVLSVKDSESILHLLMTLPNGLRHHSMHIAGLSTASTNMGVVTTDETHIMINCALRGALESFVDTMAYEMDILCAAFGFESSHEARYPAWSYDAKSPLRETLQRVCQKRYGKELELIAVHGGLECGVFKAMDETMDIVTMGPKMHSIHTPEEALDIASFDSTYDFLVQFLEAL